MGKLIGFLFGLVIVLFGLSFALLNAELVTIHFYFGAQELPLSLVIVLSVILGAVLGVIAALALVLRQRRELARERRARHQIQRELDELRRMPIKDAA